MTLEPNPVGRPASYDPIFCERVKEYGREGMSIAEMAANLGVAKRTVYNWQEQYPEFLHAMQEAIDLSQSWWEKHGRVNLYTKEFNTTLWMKNVHNRFREDWYESTKTELTGKDGGPVQISSVDKAIADIEERLGK